MGEAERRRFDHAREVAGLSMRKKRGDGDRGDHGVAVRRGTGLSGRGAAR